MRALILIGNWLHDAAIFAVHQVAILDVFYRVEIHIEIQIIDGGIRITILILTVGVLLSHLLVALVDTLSASIADESSTLREELLLLHRKMAPIRAALIELIHLVINIVLHQVILLVILCLPLR